MLRKMTAFIKVVEFPHGDYQGCTVMLFALRAFDFIMRGLWY
ncbi:hypothetical protein [Paraburkholderia bannensis]|nr:hypothetical protein [Paraburkholderia bannensis]